jgi:hypothetical protein
MIRSEVFALTTAVGFTAWTRRDDRVADDDDTAGFNDELSTTDAVDAKGTSGTLSKDTWVDDNPTVFWMKVTPCLRVLTQEWVQVADANRRGHLPSSQKRGSDNGPDQPAHGLAASASPGHLPCKRIKASIIHCRAPRWLSSSLRPWS